MPTESWNPTVIDRMRQLHETSAVEIRYEAPPGSAAEQQANRLGRVLFLIEKKVDL